MEDEEEEELEDIPDMEKKADPLMYACIRRKVDGIEFEGQVEDIEVGKVSRERLYRIKYSDGDLEHLTDDMVRSMQYFPDSGGVDEDAGVAKKPAAAKAKAKAKAKGKAKAKAKGKAKAKAAPMKAVAKSKAKAKAKAKGKAKAKAKAKR